MSITCPDDDLGKPVAVSFSDIGKRFSVLLVALALMFGGNPLAADEADDPAKEKLFYETREEIPLKDRWNVNDIVPDPEAFDAGIAKAEELVEGLEAFKGTLSDSPEALADALGAAFDLQRFYEDLFVFAMESLHTDGGNAEANEAAGRARALNAKANEALSFIDPEIVQISEDQLQKFLSHPRVAPYAHYIDNVVRLRDHILSPEVEEVLAGASLPISAHQQAFASLQDTDIKWPTILDEEGNEATVVPGQYAGFVQSEDRRVRKEGALALFDTYSQYANVFAATLGGKVYSDGWRAKARGYDSTLEMALDATNVPKSVVETLVQAVRDNVDEIHSYAALRKKIQGLDELHIYDVYVNLLPGVKKRYSFDEGWNLALQFWQETFGSEYAAVAKRARQERWIDVYSNKGKRPGAYSWGTYNSHPYLLLNWKGTLNDVSTLVHEMGHSIHQYLANQNQAYHESKYSLFVAEVASVASETIFLEWQVKRSTDPVERKLLLNHAMNNITGTFVRQIFFHEFEDAMHQTAARGEPITKDSMGKIYGDLWKTYWGPELVVDEAYKAGWSRVSHFYRTYYVWIYATSFAAGQAIAERFSMGDETAVQDYLAMLKLGGSVYPMEALKRAGVDMSDPDVIGAVMVRYGELQRQLDTALSGGEVAAQ